MKECCLLLASLFILMQCQTSWQSNNQHQFKNQHSIIVNLECLAIILQLSMVLSNKNKCKEETSKKYRFRLCEKRFAWFFVLCILFAWFWIELRMKRNSRGACFDFNESMRQKSESVFKEFTLMSEFVQFIADSQKKQTNDFEL